MAGLQFRDPVRAISGATVYAGAFVRVSATGTNDAVPIYADPGLSVRLSNPLRSDVAGRLPAIYCDPEVVYRVRATDADGGILFTEDDIDGVMQPLALPYADPRDDNGNLMPGATRTFYVARTTELAPVFANEALSTPLTNPSEANAAGAFAAVWLDVTREYRAKLEDQHGRLIYDVERLAFFADDIPPTAPVLSGVIDGTDIELEWTESISQFDTVAGYRLYDADDDSLIFDTEDPSDRDYTFGSIVDDVVYSFYVVAYDSEGHVSEHSNVVSLQRNADTYVDVFDEDGTWTNRVSTGLVQVLIFGGGGGGGSGQSAAAVTTRGGGGGSGSGYSSFWFLASELPSTVAITVGTGGAGGAPVVNNGFGSINGLPGEAGGESRFGSYLRCAGGLAGAGSAGFAGATAGGAGLDSNGGTGGTGNRSGDMGFDSTPSPGLGASGGGGAGGDDTGSGAYEVGNAGGGTPGMAVGPFAGGAGGASLNAGSAGLSTGLGFFPGTGGGGGGARSVGGAGGFPGGGGGGGGGIRTASGASGAGAVGSGGIVLVITYT
jgi:hypothetical protein